MPTPSSIFSVPDMSCSHCVGVITKALQSGLPGTPFAIDLAQHRVTIAADADTAAAILRDAGYEPALLPA